MASAFGGEDLVEQLLVPIYDPDAGLDEARGERVYAGEIVDLAETQVYHRVEREISSLAQALRAKSTGRIYAYIGWVLGALFVALLLSGVGR